MIALWVCVGAFAVFGVLYTFGKYLEKHPEKSAVGKSMEKNYSKTSKAHLKKAITETYAAAYEDALEEAREAYRVTLVRDGCSTCEHEHEPVDLDDLQTVPDRDPSEYWADIDN